MSTTTVANLLIGANVCMFVLYALLLTVIHRSQYAKQRPVRWALSQVLNAVEYAMIVLVVSYLILITWMAVQ